MFRNKMVASLKFLIFTILQNVFEKIIIIILSQFELIDSNSPVEIRAFAKHNLNAFASDGIEREDLQLVGIFGIKVLVLFKTCFLGDFDPAVFTSESALKHQL
jgi:hypothetical protein